MNALYSLYDALISINVPNERARAVVDAMEREMTTLLATKADLNALRIQMDLKFDLMAEKLQQMRSSIIIQIGSMFVVGLGLLLAALRLMQ